MGEHRTWAAGPGEDAGRTEFLPDLTGVDLASLRAMDDPVLVAAVERVLSGTGEFQEVWYSGSGEGLRRSFPAGLGRRAPDEDSGG
ncbi:hypothetical protein JK359_26190 [Streptomyces actinomycinicus]|uniref:FXSXX-COOH protein n=1 Tax=Streptomyces actinomycinicus TaxID=1695166 RepID=A0A937ENT8_9ACTN|nr:hypothetical protein [Streptomyces actinomycinicus]MBL1085415.1 hypothetical protein [Streptomyces actinomycinicus]